MHFTNFSYSGYFYCVIFSLFLIFSGCNSSNRQGRHLPAFYSNLKERCGQKYLGAVVFPEGREAPFRGKKIWLQVNNCSSSEIRIPIYTDAKVYRTLVITQEAGRIALQHENKRPDGTQSEISMYGGQATDSKSNYLLVFPADGYTRQLLGAERQSVWSLSFSSDKSTLSYIAESNGRLDLQLDFDLTKALQ